MTNYLKPSKGAYLAALALSLIGCYGPLEREDLPRNVAPKDMKIKRAELTPHDPRLKIKGLEIYTVDPVTGEKKDSSSYRIRGIGGKAIDDLLQ